MFVIINIGAFIQALILGLIFAIFSLFIYAFNLEYAFTSYNDYYLIIPVLYFCYAVLAITDRLGVKGKLFFFSTWFLCLLIILLSNPGFYAQTKDKNIFDGFFLCFNIVFPLYLWYRMIKFGLEAFNYSASTAKANLLNVNYVINDSYRDNNYSILWKDVSKSIFYPPFVYRNAYSIYRTLNRSAITPESMVTHYISVVEKIEGRAAIPSDNKRLSEIKQELIKIKNGNGSNILLYDFITDVIRIIAKENKME